MLDIQYQRNEIKKLEKKKEDLAESIRRQNLSLAVPPIDDVYRHERQQEQEDYKVALDEVKGKIAYSQMLILYMSLVDLEYRGHVNLFQNFSSQNRTSAYMVHGAVDPTHGHKGYSVRTLLKRLIEATPNSSVTPFVDDTLIEAGIQACGEGNQRASEISLISQQAPGAAMTDAAAQARIINEVAKKPELANLEKNDRYRYELYKLTIKEIFKILEGNQEGSVSLDEIRLEDLQDYKKGLEQIGSGFYALYRGGKVKGRGLEPTTIQSMIDRPGTKLTRAAELKAQGEEEECINKLKEGRLLLFLLVEHLEAVKLE